MHLHLVFLAMISAMIYHFAWNLFIHIFAINPTDNKGNSLPYIILAVLEIENNKGRVSYKIFAENEDLLLFLKKNKDKVCKQMLPIFFVGKYKDYPNTEVRKLSTEEIRKYMSERESYL